MGDSMVSMKDHEDAQGRVNWKAYTQAKVDAGEECMTCHDFMFDYRGQSSPRECYRCRRMHTCTEEEVRHEKLVRCPFCRHEFDITDYMSHNCEYRWYEPEEHDIDCPQCEKTFTVTTHVSYEFTSPAVKEDANGSSDRNERSSERNSSAD